MTPKQLATVGTIVSEENLALQTEANRIREILSLGQTPQLAAYTAAALLGKPTRIGGCLWINSNGRLEANQPKGLRPHPTRLLIRALLKAVIRCQREKVSVGEGTKIWIASLLRDSDFRKTAETTLANDAEPS